MLQPLKEHVARVAQDIFASGLTWGAGGNVSAFDPESARVVITGTGIKLSDCTPDNLVVVNLAGEKLEGNASPSSETPMHTSVYAKHGHRYTGIVHTHSPAATACACLGEGIPPFYYLMGFIGNEIPLARYATYGTPEMGKRVLEALGENKAVLLEQHGVLALGNDVSDAAFIAQTVEFIAELYLRARPVREPKLVPEQELIRLQKKFKAQVYGDTRA